MSAEPKLNTVHEKLNPQTEFVISPKIKLRVVTAYGDRMIECIHDDGPTRFIGLLIEKAQIKHLIDSIYGALYAGSVHQRSFEFSERMTLQVLRSDEVDHGQPCLRVFFYKSTEDPITVDWLNQSEIEKFVRALKTII